MATATRSFNNRTIRQMVPKSQQNLSMLARRKTPQPIRSGAADLHRHENMQGEGGQGEDEWEGKAASLKELPGLELPCSNLGHLVQAFLYAAGFFRGCAVAV